MGLTSDDLCNSLEKADDQNHNLFDSQSRSTLRPKTLWETTPTPKVTHSTAGIIFQLRVLNLR